MNAGEAACAAAADGRGVVFGSSAGFHLPDGSLMSPDASWMLRERWEALAPAQHESFAPLCPDAVSEVLSATDTLSRLRAKMRVYLANSARIAVLIDPGRRAVEVYLPDEEPRIFSGPGSLPLDPVLPGFILDLAPISG